MTTIPETIRCININTGNILSLNDLTKKPGQNPTEELTEAIKITLNEWEGKYDEHAHTVSIHRQHDNLMDKMAAQERQELKIGIKLFINSDNQKILNDAITHVFSILQVDTIDNLVLSYHFEDSINTDQKKLEHLKAIWIPLEKLTISRKILRLGLSDVDENMFRVIYEWANVKPCIIQINLNTCCVVPPSLQQFCKENEVQLLTHSDPSEILPEAVLKEIFRDINLSLHWVLRFLVHIKCRGVLSTKGYLVSLLKNN